MEFSSKKYKYRGKLTSKGFEVEKYYLEPNYNQSMIDSEAARELEFEWDESVHKYVNKFENEQ